MAEETRLIYKYLRHDKKFPHVWCPGCGNGIILGSLIRAIDAEGLEKDEVVVVSGIGCAGRLPVYVDFNTLHTTHGRALTFATGIKLANPALHVIVVMGDGDATAIGGNHLIHAARRNIDVTAIIVNNNIYGMTGGQYSPTTPYGSKASTSPYGNIEHAFNITELAIAAGAVFVGRGSVYHTRLLDTLVRKGIRKRGFSVVEVISHCPTLYGRYNRVGSAVEMMRRQKEDLISVTAAKNLSPEELQGKIMVGVLADKDLPIYQDEINAMRDRAQQTVVRK